MRGMRALPLLLALALPACAQHEASSAADCGGCRTGEVCVDGACAPQACDDATVCPIGLACVAGACARPAAECSGDADCPGGRCVEGQCFERACAEGETRGCDTACGSGEQRCRDGVWRPCSAPTPAPQEICGDGHDDDCDGAVDEGCDAACAEGHRRACDTACGPGSQTCAEGQWTACAADALESCDNGADDDCDGAVDEDCGCPEGLIRPCATDCGTGEETCTGGAWAGCTAPAPVDGRCPVTCDDAARKPSGDVRLSAPGGDARFPRALWTGDGFGVFWNDESGQGRTMLRRVNADGSPAGGPVPVVDRYFSDAAWTGDGYLVLSVAVGQLAITGVGPLGGVRDTVAQPDLTRSGLDAVAAWNGAALGVVWSENLEELHFARFDASGHGVGAPRQLTSAPGRSMSPSLVADGDGWAVAWQDERDAPDDPFHGRVYFVRLDAEGRERAAEAAVANGEDPSLVKTAGGFAVAYADARDGHDAVLLRRLDGDGAPVGDERPVSASPGNARAPSLAWTGDGFGVAWGEDVDGQSEIAFARLDATGAGDPVRLTTADADSAYPSLAWTGDGFGVAWSDERDGGDQADAYFAAGPFTCP
jgi:hypothetical protein